ncbi:hypothetical protein Pcinc_009353 [Petrolisthes cinctipes]|uniref:Uncharacterized protein n=1 Tax=Petrolisthes cinctipes TaxID=88211 RepID=A0AAE1G5D3_PETCI|nr:hypothetical protein Pcinc_009353 [Petrolisthes cinctipes]
MTDHGRQLLFTSQQLLVKCASPAGVVGCEILPGVGVDVKRLHVSLVPQLRAANDSLSCGKLSIGDVF